jgi:3-dehydroquinate synthase
MCDSCIGSKVGINMSGYKNQLGIFHPPERVFIDLDFLSTLEEKDILSGLGEIIKVHLISGENDFCNLENNYDKFITDYNCLKPFIYQSLRIKKKIVEIDEFDIKYRHILNYGHTFGHAIEAYTNNLIPHGIAVTIGMDIANYISMNNGYINNNLFDRMSITIRKNIPYQSLDFRNHSKMRKFLKGDKKYDGSKLKVILCKGVGKIFIDKMKVNNHLLVLIDEYVDLFNSAKNL